VVGAGEYLVADDQRRGTGGADVDGVARLVVGDGTNQLRLSVAALLGRDLRGHHRGDRADVRAGAGGCGGDLAGGGDGVELGRIGVGVERGHGGGAGCVVGAGEYVAADDLGDGAGRADADRVAGVVVGHGADQLRLPVAALRSQLCRRRAGRRAPFLLAVGGVVRGECAL